MKLLTQNNNKLKDQFIFDLPVSHDVCGRQCPGCYALKAQKRFPAVLEKRNRMLLASKATDFTSIIITQLALTKSTIRAVRIHSSGEFYSQAYIDKWLTIATALPQFTFYAFTKRIKDFNFVPLMALSNVVIIDSLMHSSLNYGPVERLLSGVPTCPCSPTSTIECGITCNFCMTKAAQQQGIQFLQH